MYRIDGTWEPTLPKMGDTIHKTLDGKVVVYVQSFEFGKLRLAPLKFFKI